MKKIYLIFSVLCLSSLALYAQTITVSNVEASTNDVATVKVYMMGAENCTATGFYLEFDDGLSIVGIENVKSDDMTSDHIVKVGQISDTKMRIAIYSPTNSAFELSPSSEDDNADVAVSICDLKLMVPDKAGSFKGRLAGIEVANGSDDFGTEEDVPFDIVVNENTEGIILIESDSKGKPQRIYNVSGQPLKEPQRGLNIIDGRVVIYK